MNAKPEKMETEMEAPGSTVEVRLKHIESDIAEIKSDLRTNAADITAVRESVAHLNAQIQARTPGLGEKLELRTRELWEKFEARSRDFAEKKDLKELEEKVERRFQVLEGRIDALGEKLVDQGKGLSAAIAELTVADERIEKKLLHFFLAWAAGLVGQTIWLS